MASRQIPIPGPGDAHAVRLERWRQARAASDALFAIIRPEAIYDRPIPERHRFIFYLGHLEAFDWNLMRERLLAEPSFHPEWDKLFAFGIDPVDGGLPSDQPGDWPQPEAVLEYSERVRRILDAGLERRPGIGRDPSAGQMLEVAIEHRLMHLETLAYLLHELPLDRKSAQFNPRRPTGASGTGADHSPPGLAGGRGPENPARMDQRVTLPSAAIHIPAGRATLGRRRGEGGFGWDNEYEAHTVFVPEFDADRTKVTNGAFLHFVESGGYRQSEWWRPEDWRWIAGSGRRHPHFWRQEASGEWLWRGMFADRALSLDAPVYASYAEALAYSRWVGGALPSEPQWHRMAYAEPGGSERAYPWGECEPGARHGNFDCRSWEPTAVDAHPAGDSAWGVADLIGNGWEWTSTVFAPFIGFEPFAFYPGYSADFFDGAHRVLKGGSPRTDAALLRRSFRNWFQPRYPYLFAGFRCVIP